MQQIARGVTGQARAASRGWRGLPGYDLNRVGVVLVKQFAIGDVDGKFRPQRAVSQVASRRCLADRAAAVN